MSQIAMNELPLDLQNQINEAEKKGDTVTIVTQNGTPLATITPIKKPKKIVSEKLKNRIEIIGNIVEPSSNFVDWGL
ncbi:MAG: prevent-host-death family protein [Waterburya sp.]